MKLRQTRMRPKHRLSQAAIAAKLRRDRRMMYAKTHAAKLDEAKAKTGSDGKTAQLLHTTPQRINDVRKGRRHLGPESAARLAYLLGDSPIHAVMQALAYSSRKRQTRGFWLDFYWGIWPGRDITYHRWAESKIAKRYPIWGG